MAQRNSTRRTRAAAGRTKAATPRRPVAGKPAAKKAVARKPIARKAIARKPVSAKPATGRQAGTAPSRRKSAGSAASTALRLAGVGNEAVLRATGKAWEDWLAVLDRAGAVAMPHRAIAETIRGRFGIPGWWSQMVAVGYEQARGLRAAHQKADGFAASASRTIHAALDRVYDAWADPKLRTMWLPAAPIEVRRATDGRSMRITWTLGPSSVEVNFRSEGPRKSRVQIEHGRLEDEESVLAQKAYWSEGLERLKAWLESGR